MEHDEDLTPLLRSWPYEPGRLNARRIEGRDGRARIQVRLELGILQMEAEGRPDGAQPEGCASLLEHYRQRRSQGGGGGPTLDPQACRALREEAVQYYHRYVALFALGDYAGVVRDTTRNLAVFDLCRDHAATESDRTILERFRPQVIMMRARAEAEQALREGDSRGALTLIDRGLAEMRQVFQRQGRAGDWPQSGEAQVLRGMRDALVPKLPVSQRSELMERLQAALDAENYELAAVLRDELRLLSE